MPGITEDPHHSMKLSSRQEEILAFIRESIRSLGLPPTRAEIMEHFGFASPNAAQCHLRALADKGAIRMEPGLARGIVPLHRLDSEGERERRIPVIGRVAAGQPVLAVENREGEVPVDARLFNPRADFLLRVSGDSMTGAGIHDGDLLAVHRTREARSGRVVVARIDDEVTVKRLRRKGGKVWLEAANPAYPDIHPARDGTDFELEGLGVGVLRRFGS